MKLMIEAIYLLRNKYKFNGYIHTKCIPGSSKYLIDELGKLSDRMSANIELPSNNNLKLLAPDKKSNNIFGAMSEIKNERENITVYVSNIDHSGEEPKLLGVESEEEWNRIKDVLRELSKAE